jgi:hypothetical protein
MASMQAAADDGRMNTLARSLLLALLLSACGDPDPKALTDQGSAQLGAGDAAGALTSFSAALDAMPATHPDRLRAELGRCQALARQDPALAKSEFLALSKARPGKIQEQDYGAIVRELIQKGSVVEAIEVMDAGMKAFPESPRMAVVRDQVLEASKKQKDPAALQKLKGLGYAGDE